jgi:protein gp37
MGDSTGISWTDATWNPVRGCSRVSEGCRHCYAELVAARFSGPGQAYEGLADRTRKGSKWTGVVRLVPEHLADPIRWRRPRRIFVNSMSDLFHEELTNEQIAAVFGVMGVAHHHTFQVLTKRAARMREWFAWVASRTIGGQLMRGAAVCGIEAGNALREVDPKRYEEFQRVRWLATPIRWPLPNVWLGVSVEDQDAHDKRAEELLACPAAVYFFSAEPLLGAIDASQSLRRMLRTHDGRLLRNDHPDAPGTGGTWRRPVDWIIAGCESGHKARSCGVEWLRSLRDQCASAGVSFFLKQAVEESYRRRVYPSAQAATVTTELVTLGKGSKSKSGGVIELPYLDGVQHAAFPEVSR